METTLTQGILVGEDRDVALVRRMAAGDELALDELYARHGRRLYAYAIRLTGSESRAEDVVQESLIAAWKAARGFRSQSRATTWLLGIVHNQALNATRRRQLPTEAIDETFDPPDEAERPDERLAVADRRRLLDVALGELSPEHRAVLDLVFYEGLPLAEVAAVRGCPVGTVKSRLSYAKSYLRRALERAGLRREDLL
jgi:RNA polymerase sigma-70 factor, ECF subfamily